MSRFTKKDKDGKYYIDAADMGEFTVSYNGNYSLTSMRGDMVNKLAHYEDLKNQNKLIELPCKVGDVLFELRYVSQTDRTLKVAPRKVKSLTEIVSLMESGALGDTVFTDRDIAYEACMEKSMQKQEQKQENVGYSYVVDAKLIALYIIEKCTKEKHPVTLGILQNLLFLCQKQCLQEYGKPLFHDDFVAKAFGPSIPDIYFTYAGYGGSCTTGKYGILLPDDVADCIDKIIEMYRSCAPWEFEHLVRMDNGAWKNTYNNGLGVLQVIPLKQIKKEVKDFPLELIKGEKEKLTMQRVLEDFSR